MPATPQAILFDFDGTLVDSEPLHYESWLHAVKPYGASTDWDDYLKRFVGQTGRWAARMFFEDAGVQFDDNLVAEVISVKTMHFRQMAHERLIIEQETLKALQLIPENVPVGVISSSSRLDVEPALHASGFLPRLSVLICAGDVKEHKPHPEPYLTGLEGLRTVSGRLGLTAADVAVYEDSPSGIASALAAGMAVRRVLEPRAVPQMLASETWV